MHIQAIFLAMVILVSVVLTQGWPTAIKNEPPQSKITTKEPVPSFTHDASLALKGKAQATGNNIVGAGILWERFFIGAVEENAKTSAAFGETARANARLLGSSLSAIQKEVIDTLIAITISTKTTPTQEESGVQNGLVSAQGPTNITTEAKTPPCPPINDALFDAQANFAKYLDETTPLIDKNSEKRWPIASITKLMTALVAKETLRPEAQITMSDEAVTIGGSIGNFKGGEVFTAKDLIRAMLVGSSNDAAIALVETLGKDQFINAMQLKASELGMKNTTYTEPTGLSYINQSTIRDLIKLITHIYYADPEILAISREPEIHITELRSGKSRVIANVDAFAGSWDFIGGKTGYTDEAGKNLIGLFKNKNQVLITAVLGSKNAFAETARIKQFVMSCELKKYESAKGN